jgi:septum formation protein
MSDRKFLLASLSPRRRELLRECSVDFTVKAVPVDELTETEDIRTLPQQNALLKAAAAADIERGCWVLGADTMIVLENRAIGKPADLADAAEMLAGFSGRTHEVITGMALICREVDVCEVWSECSVVKFKKLTPEIIAGYLDKVEVLDKAGAYAIQEHGEMIVENFSGELENIVGLPLKKLRTLLKKYAIGSKVDPWVQ